MEPQQPSVYNEERNILRLRAWEQRIQETGQARDPNMESVPLFGQPYKTNKGDELSTRIQRMFGSYEDVNYPHPVAMEPLSIPSYVTFPQSEQRLTHTDKTTHPPFHNQNVSNQSQKAPSRSSHPSQPTRPSAAPSSPNPCGRLSSFSPHQIKKSDSCSDHREQEMSSLSPDVKAPPYLQSAAGENAGMDTKVTFDRHQSQGSTDDPSESACTVDVSSYHLKQSPKDSSQMNKGNALPSQMFPSLLSSKQPNVVVTKRPMAYVRPMDSQDQVVSESPELKPSPEPYESLPELISKSDEGKRKTLPHYLETRKTEAQCVEDILKEMTHAWPPLLPAIHTPGPAEPSKSPFPTKEEEEEEHVSSCSGQKNCVSSSDPSQPNLQSSTSSSQAAHSRGAESTSSSDSESSSRSESDSESTTEEPPKPPVSNPVKEEPNTPAITHDSWQLGHFIRPSQSSKTKSQSITQASEHPAQKQPHSTPSTRHSAVEEVNPTKESKPQVSPHWKESAESLGKVQVCRESPQENYNQPRSQKSPDRKSCTSVRKLSSNTNSSKPAKTRITEAAPDVKSEDVVARDKDRPRVKKDAGHSRKGKDSSGAKKDVKRTSKHMSLDKRKAESEPDGTVTPHPLCQTCGGQFPNSCTCPSQNPASLGPSITINQESKSICQKVTKNSHKSKHGHRKKTEKEATTTCGPPQSLLVRIDLSLLSRIPQKSNTLQETLSKSKRSDVVLEQDGGGGDADATHKVGIISKKNIPQNVEVGNTDIPRKKRKLENNDTSSSHPSVKTKSCKSTEGSEQKKAKKNPSPQPAKTKTSVKKTRTPEAVPEESSKKVVNGKDSRKNKKGSEKHTERSHPEKKLPKSSNASTLQSTRKAVPQRPLLQVEHRQYPVKHYIKEAQKLKHKADAESDKMNKAFNYLEAAMYFVESGIAMEKDPQISTSSHTMFAETVELLKFVLKFKNSVDPSTPPKEKDFLALGLKCQSLLQMAMFRHKQKTALKYSKTLTDHFNISSQKTPDPSASASKSSNTPSPAPNLPSPANVSTSSGSVVDPVSSAVAVPQAIEQVAFTYVSITTLFLSAQDIWEQAEELALKGSGLLKELDTVMGPLSLASSMSSMVRYTRQGVHWLRLDSVKAK